MREHADRPTGKIRCAGTIGRRGFTDDDELLQLAKKAAVWLFHRTVYGISSFGRI
jgi:hypothetical protein